MLPGKSQLAIRLLQISGTDLFREAIGPPLVQLLLERGLYRNFPIASRVRSVRPSLKYVVDLIKERKKKQEKIYNTLSGPPTDFSVSAHALESIQTAGTLMQSNV